MNKLLLICCLICFPKLLSAQASTVDSLKGVLVKFSITPGYENDTNYINTLNYLAFKYNQIKPDTTIILSQQSIKLCDKINYWRGKVEALKNTGLAYNVKGDYSRCLAIYAEALDLAKKSGITDRIGSVYYATGIVYSNLGKYPEALENYFEALKLREEKNDKLGIASCTNAIGAIYFVQGKYTDALNNYKKALKQSEEINYTAGIESAYANIGEVYFRQGKFEEAEGNLVNALKLNEKTGNRENRAFFSNMAASIYLKQRQYNKALESYLTTKELAQEIGSPEYKSRSYLGLGEVQLAIKNFDNAITQTEEGIKIAGQIHYNELLRDGNEILSRVYEAKGAGMQALYHQKLFKLYADSINNQQTEQTALNLTADYEYSKKEMNLKAEQEKKELTFQKKSNQQRWIIFSAFAALFSVVIVTGIIFRSRQKEKKANHLLHHQNIEIDKQKNFVEKALVELKATQAQLIQSEKMASLGELTAGIAHEIQNPLNFVNNFSEVSTELIDEMNIEINKGNLDDAKQIANDLKQNLEKINHHGKRAGDIVKGMLQHSRSSSGKKEPTNINALADEYLRLAYHGLKAKDKSFNATMKTDYDESIGNINIIPQDIGRVILNLLTNAFYAASPPTHQGGISDPAKNNNPTVWVKTSKNPPSGNQVEGGLGTKFGGAWIEISVQDNGSGIPQKILDKIFQPFFTTKPTGQGTGLGLSLSYDIVKAHGGEIKVNTKNGGLPGEETGTEFIISLPA